MATTASTKSKRKAQARKAPPTSRAEKAAQTRADLIDAARRVIAAKGYEAASVDEIAKAAGYTKGALYAHFASKEELSLTMLTEFNELAAETLEASRPSATDANPLATEDEGWEMVLSLEAYLYALRHPEKQDVLAPMAERSINALAQMVHTMRSASSQSADIGGEPSQEDRIAAIGLAATNTLGSIMMRILPPDWNVPEIIAELDTRIRERIATGNGRGGLGRRPNRLAGIRN